MKKLYLIFLTLILTGCISAPKPTDTFTVGLSKTKSEQIVYDNAMSNWSRTGSVMGKDAYMVERLKFGHNRTLITVRRYASDINLRPFLVVELTEVSNSETKVNVLEGECAIGCYENYSPDVREWLRQGLK